MRRLPSIRSHTWKARKARDDARAEVVDARDALEAAINSPISSSILDSMSELGPDAGARCVETAVWVGDPVAERRGQAIPAAARCNLSISWSVGWARSGYCEFESAGSTQQMRCPRETCVHRLGHCCRAAWSGWRGAPSRRPPRAHRPPRWPCYARSGYCTANLQGLDQAL